MKRTCRKSWSILTFLLAVGCYFPEIELSEVERQEIEQSLLNDASHAKPKIKIGAIIENQVRLIGIDLSRSSARPNDVVEVTYYIESLVNQTEDNEIFVHLQGRRAGMWQNLDHTPIKGRLPLRKLKRGQVVKDVQRFRVKSTYPPGGAKLYWGLYRGKKRLQVSNPDEVKHDKKNRVIISNFVVLPPRPPVEIFAYQAQEMITIDGKLEEASWAKAKWTKYWGDPLGRNFKTRRNNSLIPRTRAKLIWQSDALYIAIESFDTHIWANLTERDSNTWEEEVVEVFLDPDGDKRDYLELQVTPANVVFDALFAYRRSNLKKARAWNYNGWQTQVFVEGTLNQKGDRDTRYLVEMKLPLKEIPGAPAALNTQSSPWRINMFRFDWNEAPKGRQKAAALSPTYVGDFHALEAFAKLKFTATPDPVK